MLSVAEEVVSGSSVTTVVTLVAVIVPCATICMVDGVNVLEMVVSKMIETDSPGCMVPMGKLNAKVVPVQRVAKPTARTRRIRGLKIMNIRSSGVKRMGLN